MDSASSHENIALATAASAQSDQLGGCRPYVVLEFARVSLLRLRQLTHACVGMAQRIQIELRYESALWLLQIVSRDIDPAAGQHQACDELMSRVLLPHTAE